MHALQEELHSYKRNLLGKSNHLDLKVHELSALNDSFQNTNVAHEAEMQKLVQTHAHELQSQRDATAEMKKTYSEQIHQLKQHCRHLDDILKERVLYFTWNCLCCFLTI